jgi:hypothetical protein
LYVRGQRRVRERLACWREWEQEQAALLKERARILEKSCHSGHAPPAVIIQDAVHPGVKIVIGAASLAVQDTRSGGRFYYDPDANAVNSAPL